MSLSFLGALNFLLMWQNHSPPGGNHPWHLHGQNFYVVGHGFGRYNRSLEANYEKLFNLVDPPYVSTTVLYDGTWIAIRFWAKTTGVWNFHCTEKSFLSSKFLEKTNLISLKNINNRPFRAPYCFRNANFFEGIGPS